MENESPSVRKIHEAVQTMIENGHPNVPALLRRIAKDLESTKPEKPEGTVIIFPGCKRRKDDEVTD